MVCFANVNIIFGKCSCQTVTMKIPLMIRDSRKGEYTTTPVCWPCCSVLVVQKLLKHSQCGSLEHSFITMNTHTGV